MKGTGTGVCTVLSGQTYEYMLPQNGFDLHRSNCGQRIAELKRTIKWWQRRKGRHSDETWGMVNEELKKALRSAEAKLNAKRKGG
jgi:hypothetical protein